MNTATTLGAYALGLAAVFAGAVAVGSAVGPVGIASDAAPHGDEHGAGDSAGHGAGHGERAADRANAPAPGGLAVSQDGYTLDLARTTLPAGQPADLSFTVLGPDGTPLQEYEETHEKDLHLVVVRRDLTGFQHVHPDRDAAGRWSVPLTLAEPGPYKVYADFAPEGRERALVLAADVTVPGSYTPRAEPDPAPVAVVDDYAVQLRGDLVAGKASPVTLSVTRSGQDVTDLEPYLGAYGHLVALREGDLAYLHVHPDGGDAGPDIPFVAEVPTAGDYRLFLDFAHGGEVRTAAFDAVARSSRGDADEDAGEDHGDAGAHDH